MNNDDPYQKTGNEIINTFINGRKYLEEILDELRPKNHELSNRLTIISGQKGTGKSHFLLMTALRINSDKTLRHHYLPVTFPGESYKFGSLDELLKDGIERIFTLIGGGIIDPAGDITRLKKEFGNTCAIGDNYLHMEAKSQPIEIENIFFSILVKISKAIGKKIIFLLENLNYLLGEKLSSKELKRLRSFMQKNPNTILIIGSALTGPGQDDQYGKSIYKLFKFRRLTGLNRNEMRLFLEMAGNWRNNTAISHKINKFRGEIEVFRVVTSGNPRLILFLYEILEENEELVIDDILGKLVELIPFFKSETEKLSVSKQMVIDALCVGAPTQTPSGIAAYLNEPPGIVNENLNRLSRDGWVKITSGKGQDRKKTEPYYSISDYFYRLWYQIHESVYLDKNVKWMAEIICLVFNEPELIEKHNAGLLREEEEEIQSTEKKILVLLVNYIKHTERSKINREELLNIFSIRYGMNVVLPESLIALFETLKNSKSLAARIWSGDPLFKEVVKILL